MNSATDRNSPVGTVWYLQDWNQLALLSVSCGLSSGAEIQKDLEEMTQSSILPWETGTKQFVISYCTGSTDTGSRTMQSSLKTSRTLHWECGSFSASESCDVTRFQFYLTHTVHIPTWYSRHVQQFGLLLTNEQVEHRPWFNKKKINHWPWLWSHSCLITDTGDRHP